MFPTHPGVRDIIEALLPQAKYGPASLVPRSGNAPSILESAAFARTMPHWAEMNARIEANSSVASRLGWVRDMYGFSLACRKAGLELDVDESMMIQPPNSVKRTDAPLFHYTWGTIISDSSGAEVWRWDKREYTSGQYAAGPRELTPIPAPPTWDASKGYKCVRAHAPGSIRTRALRRTQPIPPRICPLVGAPDPRGDFSRLARRTCRLQDGNKMTEEGLSLIHDLVRLFNEALESLPRVPAGFNGDLEAAQRAALPGARAKREAAQRMTVINKARENKEPDVPDVFSQRLVAELDKSS